MIISAEKKIAAYVQMVRIQKWNEKNYLSTYIQIDCLQKAISKNDSSFRITFATPPPLQDIF